MNVSKLGMNGRGLFGPASKKKWVSRRMKYEGLALVRATLGDVWDRDVMNSRGSLRAGV